MPTPITEQPPVKRGRGRPPGKDANGVSSNERLLPAPPRFSIQDFQQFVKYWLELVPEHRTRVTVHVYRHWPVIDRKKVDEKANTSIEVFPGENPPFEAARDWEDTLLRLYGSGDYMFWLNEMGKTVCKGFARPRRDMENYPPLVELSELVDDDPTNKSYVDYLRKRNLYTPAMLNAKQTEEDMATNEALQSAIQSANEMAHLAVSTSARQNVPVPPANQDRLIETLVKPMMSMMEKSTEQAVAMVKQQNSGSDPLAVVEMVLKMQAQNSVTAAQSSKPLEIMLQQMATQNAALLERLLNKEAAASTPPPQKTVLEQLRELKEMKELLRDDDGDNDGDGHKSKNNGAGIGGMIIEALPALTNLGLGLWGQFNQTLAYTAMIKNGQTPQAALPQQQPNAAPQTTTTQSPDPAGTMPPQTNGAPPPAPSGPPLNPETGLPYTEAETENLRALAAQYAPLHPVIEAMRPTIVECIANPDKDGYDVAEWFLEQHGRAFYNQIKIQATTEKLYDAMRSYAPLWSQIGQRAEDVKELARQFLHFDEDEIDEVGTGDEGVKPEVLPN